MKIHCKSCNKQLTNDMFKTSMGKRSNYDYQPEEGFYQQHTFKSGRFIEFKRKSGYNNKWSDDHPAQVILPHPRCYKIGRDSILEDVIPSFKDGGGCCDWSHTFLVCECGNTLGEMSLDCYQEGVVYFTHDAIIRRY